MKKKRFADFSDLGERYPELEKFIHGTEPLEGLFEIEGDWNKERAQLYKKLYKGIGYTCYNTLRLPNNNILRVKTEYTNPMGNSHYSRFWLPYLFLAEVTGQITPGESKLLEITSGNSGIALAMAAQELGYDLTILIPESLPYKGRVAPMEAKGAKVVKIKGYVKECMGQLKRMLVKDKDYFALNHSEEKGDVLVHIMKRIAKEYDRDFGTPDYVISGIGNGTSTMAMYEYFKDRHTKIIGYYPFEKDIVLGLYVEETKLRHVPLAKAICEKLVDTNELDLDEIKESIKHNTELKNLGPSSLYAIGIAMEMAKKTQGKTFFSLGYDKIDRYEP